MNKNLTVGLSAEICRNVREQDLASEVGSGLVSVFSTAMLVAGMEEAAVKAVQPYLAPGQTTVGVGLDISHKAATPLNMRVCFRAKLKEISPGGKSLTFHVEASDEVELIGEGSHRRVIVDQAQFEGKARSKKSGLKN